MVRMARIWVLAFSIAATALLLYWSFPSRVLTVAFLDVGQGDAIFIEGPTGVQVLVDGGATPAVLRELGRVMPWYDRSIDAVVATHPDLDHIGGLVDVMRRYRISVFLEPGVPHTTAAWRRLEEEVAASSSRVLARRGMRLMLGGGAYADILYPEGDTSRMDPNDASVVMRIVYGKAAFMLTGDAPIFVERELVSVYGDLLASGVLKAGHHGSKTSTSPGFVSAVQPTYAIISAGKDNRYGHPHSEVLHTLLEEGAHILGTYDRGTIRFVSDGKRQQIQ